MPAGRIAVGASGWVYDHWKGRFYPDDLPKSKWFAHYADRFRSVEVNHTFYRLPTEKSVARWRDASPEGFTFAFKASRYVTHQKRLQDARAPVRRLLDRLTPLGDKLGALLFQTPPNLPRDHDRLRRFLQALPAGGASYALEFRHPSWHHPETHDLLGEHGVGLCIHDFGTPGDLGPLEVTAQTVYLRFHGAQGSYHGEYGTRKLRPWAERMAQWRRGRHDVYAYFNNDWEAKAVADARALGRAVSRLTGARVLAAQA